MLTWVYWLFDIDNIQGQSADPPAEGPEAALPWLWTPHSLDPGSAGKNQNSAALQSECWYFMRQHGQSKTQMTVTACTVHLKPWMLDWVGVVYLNMYQC